MRWKTVTVPATRSTVSSTYGVRASGSVFWPSQRPPTSMRGRTTVEACLVSWSTAFQVTLPPPGASPPCCAATYVAVRRLVSTACCTDSPCVSTTEYRPCVMRSIALGRGRLGVAPGPLGEVAGRHLRHPGEHDAGEQHTAQPQRDDASAHPTAPRHDLRTPRCTLQPGRHRDERGRPVAAPPGLRATSWGS